MCLKSVYCVSGRFLEGGWKVAGRCLEGVWRVSEWCLEGVGKVSGRFPLGIWEQAKSGQVKL